MSVRVQNREPSSSVEPLVCEMPPEPKVAAPKVCQASRDEVEQFRATENDARAGFVGRKLEQYFHGMLESVPEGGKKELELSAEGGEDEVGSAKLKLGVEHQGGQYLVSVQGAAAMGIGGLSKVADATVEGGLTGTVTFRFGSSKEAADAMAALVQATPETGIGGPGARVLAHFVRDDDALERAFHTAGRLQSVDVAGTLSGKAEVSSKYGKDEVTIRGDAGWTPDDLKLDLAKREVVVSTSIDAGLDGSVSKEMLSGLLDKSKQIGDVRGSVSLEQHFPVSLQDIEQVQKRGLAALKEIAADSTRRSRTEAVVRLEGNAGGLDFKAERRGSPGEMLEAVEHGDVLRWQDWSFQGFKTSSEVSTKLDAGPLKLEASVKDQRTVITGKGELASLVHYGSSKVQEAQQQEREVTALRACAR